MPKDSKKIIFLNHSSRTSPRINNEIKTLSEKYEIEVINWNRQGEIPKNNRNINQKFINLKAPLGSHELLFFLLIFYWKVYQNIKEEKINIIHCTHLFLLPISILIGKIQKAKVVYDAYERYAIDISSRAPFFQKLISKIIEHTENWLVTKTDGVLTIDSPEGFLERRYKIYNKNTEILFNIPDLTIRPDQETLKKIKPKYKEKKILAYTGGLTKGKGIIETIKVTARLKKQFPQIVLLLIGEFPDSNTGHEVRRTIQETKTENNVELISWIDYPKLLSYLTIANIGLALHQPHKRFRYVAKGTGRKFFTYMQAGLPIVGPNFWEIAQIVREENCGVLIDTTAPEKIAEAILYFLENPGKAAKMGQKGRKAIEEKYNWERESQKLLRVYEKLLKV